LSMEHVLKDDILKLSVSERIRLVEDIWDSIRIIPEEVELTENQKSELDKRLEAHDADPNRVSTWEDVRNRMLNDE
jgi:putative addiction module component (TIGR02574 family)